MDMRTQKAKRCMERAKATMGPGWEHIGPDIRWALVCAQIVGLLDAQDDSIAPQTAWGLFLEVKSCCQAMARGEGWL